MKRLVYAPQVNVWIKTETGIFDLSPYVTDFSIHRKVDAISSASITFRNPKVEGSDGEPRFMFTQHPVSNVNGDISYKPMFYPMDPIIITLTRLKGYPVQVFTGYCDKTPYIQLYPGVSQLTASCSLKKLKYTYWDPGLPFVYDYLKSLGWIPSKDGGLAYNPKTMNNVPDSTLLNDSSFGHLVYRILQDIGGWDHNDIYVQGLPSSAINNIVDGIYTDLTGDAKANFKDVKDFLNKVIGTTTVGGAAGGGNNSGNTGGGGGAAGTSNLPPYAGEQGKLTPSEAKAAARSMLKDFGWPESEFSPLESLWEHESNWKWDALNSSSGAYGIPQSKPANKMGRRSEGGGPDYLTNAVTQIKWGLTYIKNRSDYGSPSAAWDKWQSRNPHWY